MSGGFGSLGCEIRGRMLADVGWKFHFQFIKYSSHFIRSQKVLSCTLGDLRRILGGDRLKLHMRFIVLANSFTPMTNRNRLSHKICVVFTVIIIRTFMSFPQRVEAQATCCFSVTLNFPSKQSNCPTPRPTKRTTLFESFLHKQKSSTLNATHKKENIHRIVIRTTRAFYIPERWFSCEMREFLF